MSTFRGGGNYTSLSDMVYRHLRDSITEGRYQKGDFLVELKIAEELGVSRTPVREALKQLELEDLVTSYPNRGAVVNGITEMDIEDSFTIRKLLEGQAAYWAAQRITDAQLESLAEIVELMDLYTRKNDARHLVRLDTEFHDVIYDACQSRTLRNILTTLHQNIHLARKSSLTIPERTPKSLDEHRKIYNALESRDADAAKACVEQHAANAAEASES